MMRKLRPVRLGIFGAVTALAALGASGLSTSAYGAETPARATSAYYSVSGSLNAVADISPTDAWAVGWTGSGSTNTLIVHWNGKKWSPVTNLKPVSGDLLNLTVDSPTNIWAAGYTGNPAAPDPLIMHWNGKSWSRLAGVPTVKGVFNAVADVSGHLLAVGALVAPPMLNMERTGTKWQSLPVPAAPGDLESLVVTGAHSAWAAGVTVNQKTGYSNGDVLMHWNGTKWLGVSSFPLHGVNEEIWHLAAGPHGAVWAVGEAHTSDLAHHSPRSMVWNGKTWAKVSVPAPANSALYGVSYVPGGTAWAVGYHNLGADTLILRWTGKAWSQVAAPNRTNFSNDLFAVSASSVSDAWAVGRGGAAGLPKTIILHWNGHSWS
jgi:hypothetical protein